MLFRVVIPAGAKPGQLLRIKSPDGTEGDVRMPPQLSAGESFFLEMATWEGSSSSSEIDDAAAKNFLTRGQLEEEMAAKRDIFAASFYRNVHVETVDPSSSLGTNGSGIRRRRATTLANETLTTATVSSGNPPPRILIHRGIPVALSQKLGYQFGCAASSSSDSASSSSMETGHANNQNNSSASGRLSISLTTSSSAPTFGGGEPVSRADFLAALLIGFFIGMSIVGGFIVGVLLVTEPEPSHGL